MLTFLRLGKKGNLGNQLFQVASTIAIAKRNGHGYCFPDWKMNSYFKNPLPLIPQDEEFNWEKIKEQQFNFYQWNVAEGNFSLDGWFQTEKYFLDLNIKEIFSFKKEYEDELLAKYHHLFTKPTVLISVRRGDFVDNKYYFQTSYRFYFTALLKHFPDFENYNFIFTSDNIGYCKKHFSFLPNSYFLEDLSAVEQLCLAKNFDHFVISNSTFSWWIAWLGEKENSQIICPEKNFDGIYSDQYDESDYFCERWITHSEKETPISNKYRMIKIKGDVLIIKQKIRNFIKKKYYIMKGWPTDLR